MYLLSNGSWAIPSFEEMPALQFFNSITSGYGMLCWSGQSATNSSVVCYNSTNQVYYSTLPLDNVWILNASTLVATTNSNRIQVVNIEVSNWFFSNTLVDF